MLNILLAIHLIITLLLIVTVLVQRSEGGGLGIGGGNNANPSGLGKLTGMQRLTWVLGAAFFTTSLILTILAANASGNSSILDQLDGVSASEVIQEQDAASEDAPVVPADPNAQ